MSPSDRYFLQSLGIAPEEISPAGPVTCPKCAGKRHRLGNVLLICLSCAAREKREAARQEALEIANVLQERRYGEALPEYRGFEIAHLEGAGWAYRRPGCPTLGHWLKAKSAVDAIQRIDRALGPVSREMADDDVYVAHHCWACGEPCGPTGWCRSCGLDKFGRR